MNKRYVNVIAKLVLLISIVSMFVSLIAGVRVLLNIIFRESAGGFTELGIWVAIFILSRCLMAFAERKLEKKNDAK